MIWGIGTDKFPYVGYISIKITFDTLVVVCPRPPGAKQNSILIVTNTDLVRRLLVPLIGKEDSVPKRIHPQFHQAFKRGTQEQSAPAEGVGRL